jgi:hypothetical protein
VERAIVETVQPKLEAARLYIPGKDVPFRACHRITAVCRKHHDANRILMCGDMAWHIQHRYSSDQNSESYGQLSDRSHMLYTVMRSV